MLMAERARSFGWHTRQEPPIWAVRHAPSCALAARGDGCSGAVWPAVAVSLAGAGAGDRAGRLHVPTAGAGYETRLRTAAGQAGDARVAPAESVIVVERGAGQWSAAAVNGHLVGESGVSLAGWAWWPARPLRCGRQPDASRSNGGRQAGRGLGRCRVHVVVRDLLSW